jgi:hypothetical protein
MKIPKNSELKFWYLKKLWKFKKIQNLVFGILSNYENSKEFKFNFWNSK